MNLKMLSKLMGVIIPAIIMARYPFIQNLTVTSVSYESGYVVISGTMRVQFTGQAWTDFGYKDGNFYWFNEWWQEQVGETHGAFKLVSIRWAFIEHTGTYDKLGFVITLEPKAHVVT